MNNFTLKIAAAAMIFGGSVSLYASNPSMQDFAGVDMSRFLYKGKVHSENVLRNQRQQQIQEANAIMAAGLPGPKRSMIRSAAKHTQEASNPSLEWADTELFGDMDAPNGELWFYTGNIKYEEIQHEYFLERNPIGFNFTIYNTQMQKVGTVKYDVTLRDDEVRVTSPGISLLPIITKNYFNSDDKYEVVVSIMTNPKDWYGVIPRTYIFSLGGEKDDDGNDVPVKVLDGTINDVCDASVGDNENIVMTFVSEGNDSDTTMADDFWGYQLGNYMSFKTYAKANAQGDLQEVFSNRITYYQYQGDQQYTPPLMTMVHNGKPTIVMPYYEEVFYNPFYSNNEDISQRLPNNLIIDIYELNDIATGFEKIQTTKIKMSKGDSDNIVASYYAVGDFSYTDDVIFGADGKASFIITRIDMLVGDSSTESYYFYNHKGQMGNEGQPLFTNVASHARLSNIEGFDPMEIFIIQNGEHYIFNFMNMSTLKTELSISNGLVDEWSDEPDYMMANLDRVKVGDTFMYVAEMSLYEPDELNPDIKFHRIAWLDRQGKLVDMDYVNMGDDVNYATIFINGLTLDPDYFHAGPEHEYMILIKRAINGSNDTTSEEQLLIAQARSDENPYGKDLLLLKSHETYGPIASIIPYFNPNRLGISYKTTDTRYTTVYYDLPLNKAGIQGVAADDKAGNAFDFDGKTVKLADTLIEVFNMQGMRVATGLGEVSVEGYVPGVYFVRAGSETGKIAVK